MIENNIKRCREALEMTQEELGYIFGVSNKTVAGWENGYDTMPLTKMIKFANLYHYSLDYITGLAKENYYKPIIYYTTVYKKNNNIELNALIVSWHFCK